MHRTASVIPLLLLATVARAADEPVMVAGWDPTDGHVLLEAANCVACHDAGAAKSQLASKQPPILTKVGTRVTPQYLRSYLADPLAAKPGTTMPNLLHGLPAEERAATVEALTHYLVSLGGPVDQKASGSSLAQIDRGRVLYHSVGCVACHAPFDEPPEHESTLPKGLDPEDLAELGLPGTAPAKPSVPLGPLAKKYTVASLTEFLQNPLHSRPSGWMPRTKMTAGEAAFIASYLLRDQYDEDESASGVGLDLAIYKGSYDNVPDFEKLTPVAETFAKGFASNQAKVNGQQLGSNFALRFSGIIDVPADGEYRFWTKSDDASTLTVDGQVVVNNNGVHPPVEKTGKINLKKGKHTFEVGFAQVGGGHELTVNWQPPGGKRGNIPEGLLLHSTAAMIPEGVVDFTVDPALAATGKQQFTKLGCASCHDIGEPRYTVVSKPLLELKSDEPAGCLGESVPKALPKYFATAEQKKAMQKTLAALQAKPEAEVAAADVVRHTMTRFNCYACHQREKRGGPDVSRADFFQYEVVVDFGDEGRMPPAVNEVGAKLTDEGFAAFLQQGVRNRTYMATRMPLFGEKNVAHLPAAFRAADAGKIPAHAAVKFTPKLVDDGRTLVGKKGLVCINCHAWGGNRLPGAEGLDLLTVSQRIKPEWFAHLIRDPQQLRPGTRMPTPFPNGKTPFENVQGGDVGAQIDAIWAYLAAGRRGGIPFGLSPEDGARLVPSGEPITFRTFVDQVGAHTVLVGYRQRVNFGFDTNRVKSVIAWSGDFVGTRETWEGRAGQYVKVPDGSDVVKMPDGPTFAVLESGGDPWPKDLPKKGGRGSTRTPEGWEFKGYRFDEDRNPTFMYEFKGVEISEKPTAGFTAEGGLLKRTFELTTKEPVENLHLMLDVGQIVEEDGKFTVDDQRTYAVESSAPAFLRPEGDTSRLLVPVRFEKAKDGSYQATVVVDLVW